ncbi:TetR/AcrR family transcriptional regulator [Kineosporia sp. J2-2]|uniref:TetR/AcrR family transcriptional regulator n=1 Tax=Kineosporia corallincola TaxID=2835133 RepID=A0ABS5TJB9_9ACTN|nr:TetR/AcrR family transcriptional regulator [Kineosporia corallincola]MBT0770306.1 TetR/AcrR family transcriptional regulator [Kineosporia corallincola]
MTRKTEGPGAAPRTRGRGRRPIDEVQADVLRATSELIVAEGTADLTFDRVAKAAGVSKTTLYKLWPSPRALALEAYFHVVSEPLAFDHNTDLRTDLLQQLHSFAQVMQSPVGRSYLELVGASQTDHELSLAIRARYSSERRELAYRRLAEAQDRGEIREHVDVKVLVDQLWGAVYHRLLVPDEPVTHAFIEALVANLLDGVGPAR